MNTRRWFTRQRNSAGRRDAGILPACLAAVPAATPARSEGKMPSPHAGGTPASHHCAVVLTVLTAAVMLAAVSAYAQKPPVKADPKVAKPAAAAEAVSAYDRLDEGLLSDMLGSMHMTELADAIASQPLPANASVPQLWGKAKAMMAKSGSMAADPAGRRKLLDEVAVILEKIIERSAAEAAGMPDDDLEKKAPVLCKALEYRLTLVDLYGRAQCAVNAESLMMLMGGEEDRRWVMEYTGRILTPGKDSEGNPTRTKLEELQDNLDRVREDVKGDPVIDVNWGVHLETLQHKLKYSSAWFKLYRAVASLNSEERARLLQEAIQHAELYAKGDWEGAEGPDASSRLLQGEAATELAMTHLMRMRDAQDAAAKLKAAGKAQEAANKEEEVKTAKADADKDFANADNYLKSVLEVEGVSADLKATMYYQRARSLIEAGKYEEALKAVDAYGPLILDPKMLGKEAQIRADVNTALLKNHLYLRWSETTADKAMSDKYKTESQNALLAFLTKHKDQTAINAAFYKIIANKYRDIDPKGLGPIFLFALANDEFNSALDEARAGMSKKDFDEKLKQNPRLLQEIVAKNPSVKKHLEKAQELFTMILNDPAEDAKSLAEVPQIVGVVEDLLDLGEKAADTSAKMKYPPAVAENDSREGLLNACTIYRRVLMSKPPRTTDVKACRAKFIAAMSKVLSNAEWTKDPKVSVWFIDLGEQYSLAAAGEKDLQKKIAIFEECVKAFRQVPRTNHKMFMYAQHRSLGQEYEMVRALKYGGGDAGKVATMSNELIKRLGEYVALVQSTAKEYAGKTSDEDKKFLADIREWGAYSAFDTAIVMFDFLNLQKEALDKLDQLPVQWPDAGEFVIMEAAKYQTSKHIERGETELAIRRIDDIRKKHPTEANNLMQMVIGQIRDNIRENENDPARKAEVQKLREKYLLFAKELLKQHPDDYAYQQMEADAMLQNGDFAGARGRFDALAKTEQKFRAEFEKKIDAMCDKLQADMDAAKGNAPAMTKLATEFGNALKDLPPQVKQAPMDPKDKGYVNILESVVKWAQEAKTPEELLARCASVQAKHKLAVAGLRKDLKTRIPRDSVNIAGMARLLKADKKFGDALEYYKQLIAGLEVRVNDAALPEPQRKAYEAQYGLALWESYQCRYQILLTEAKEQQVASAKSMLLGIKRYRETDPNIWGKVSEFNGMEGDLLKITGGK